MTIAAPSINEKARKIDRGAQRQARITGWVLVALAVLVAGVFARGSVGEAVFRLSKPTDLLVLPDLSVPAAAFGYVASVVLAFLGARELLRADTRAIGLSHGLGMVIAVAAFLVWATAGNSFSLTGMLQATVIRAVPIALGGLAGVLSERVAVVNIAIEGMLWQALLPALWSDRCLAVLVGWPPLLRLAGYSVSSLQHWS